MRIRNYLVMVFFCGLIGICACTGQSEAETTTSNTVDRSTTSAETETTPDVFEELEMKLTAFLNGSGLIDYKAGTETWRRNLNALLKNKDAFLACPDADAELIEWYISEYKGVALIQISPGSKPDGASGNPYAVRSETSSFSEEDLQAAADAISVYCLESFGWTHDFCEIESGNVSSALAKIAKVYGKDPKTEIIAMGSETGYDGYLLIRETDGWKPVYCYSVYGRKPEASLFAADDEEKLIRMADAVLSDWTSSDPETVSPEFGGIFADDQYQERFFYISEPDESLKTEGFAKIEENYGVKGSDGQIAEVIAEGTNLRFVFVKDADEWKLLEEYSGKIPY